MHCCDVPTEPQNLPDDPALLRQMLRKLHDENDKLRLLIQRFMRHQFGRRSEQLTVEQLQFGMEDLEQTAAENQAAQDATEPTGAGTPKPRADRPARNHGALPAHLPRYEVVIDVEHEACPCCGGRMHSIGELRTEQLDILPARLRVRVTRRPRYACRACEGAVVVAEAPARPIDGGMPTEALIVHVVVSKFCDSLPLCRQSQMLARQGIRLDRSTLSNWVGSACWWLTPLYDLVLSTVLSSTKVFADDTTLPVLDPGRGRTKTGRLWCYAVDDRPWCGLSHPAAAYVYSEDRKGARPAAHLAHFQGVLQVDGYAGFKRLAGDRPDDAVRPAFCWAEPPRVPRAQRVQWRRRGTCVATSSSSMPPRSRRSPPKCWHELPHSTRSRRRYGASLPTIDDRSDRDEVGRSLRPCMAGCTIRSLVSPALQIWRRPCATRYDTGPGWSHSSRTVVSR